MTEPDLSAPDDVRSPVPAAPVLRVAGLGRAFDGKRVFEGASFQLMRGDWLLLVGPNGVGKSVLARCVAGLLPFTEGSVSLDDTRLAPGRSAALRAGIDYIPQNRDAPDGVSLADFLAARGSGLGHVRARDAIWCSIRRAFASLDEPYRSECNDLRLTTPLAKLSPQMLLLAYLLRALARPAERPLRVLILDEPTAGLPLSWMKSFFVLLRQLTWQLNRQSGPGLAILAIAHPEQIEASGLDLTGIRSAVLTRGGVGETLAPPDAVYDFLLWEHAARPSHPRWRAACRTPNSTFEVGPGDVVAVVGEVSSVFAKFCEELAKHSSFTFTKLTSGELNQLRYSYLPADARRSRLAEKLSWLDNSIVFRWYEPDVASGVGPFQTISRSAIESRVLEPLILTGGITGGADRSHSDTLSGGNCQRFVVARSIAASPDLLVCVDVFTGVDHDGITRIGDMLRAHAARGHAVVLCTSNPSGAECALANVVHRL